MKLWNVTLLSTLVFVFGCEKSPDMDLPQPNTGVVTLASQAAHGEANHGEHAVTPKTPKPDPK